jgi:hypothetical protein
MYVFLEKTLAGANYKWIWGAKLPLKIKIFMWATFSKCYCYQRQYEKEEMAWISSLLVLHGK